MSSTSDTNKLEIEYGGAIKVQLPSGDFSKIKRLNNYPAIIEYLSKNWSETHTLSDKQLLLIPERTEFFSKFMSDNGYIIEARPPKKEHLPKPKTDVNSLSAAVGGGAISDGVIGIECNGDGGGDDCKDEYTYGYVDKFMQQVEKDIKITIKKENTAEIIVPNEEQSKLLKKNTDSNVLDIRIMLANSILSTYRTNCSQIKSHEKRILSIIKNIPNELDEEVDDIVLKREYLEKLKESIQSFQELLFEILDDFEIEYTVFELLDDKSTNKFFKLCIDEYNLRKKIVELDKKLISSGLEECEEYSEEEYLKKEKELELFLKG
jgi:hypothetical protein